jgi:hypothetical protein
MVELISAIATTLLIIIITNLLSGLLSTRLIAATILCSIAFIYVGFSLKSNPVGLVILEVGVAIGFYLIAVIGYSKNPPLIAYGIVLHGIWDFLHHGASIVKTTVPEYWPLYCIIVDFLLGFYFLLSFREKNPGSGSNLKPLQL